MLEHPIWLRGCVFCRMNYICKKLIHSKIMTSQRSWEFCIRSDYIYMKLTHLFMWRLQGGWVLLETFVPVGILSYPQGVERMISPLVAVRFPSTISAMIFSPERLGWLLRSSAVMRPLFLCSCHHDSFWEWANAITLILREAFFCASYQFLCLIWRIKSEWHLHQRSGSLVTRSVTSSCLCLWDLSRERGSHDFLSRCGEIWLLNSVPPGKSGTNGIQMHVWWQDFLCLETFCLLVVPKVGQSNPFSFAEEDLSAGLLLLVKCHLFSTWLSNIDCF